MSYILDALQRADAERARGSVPTLNARPVTAPLTNNGPGVRQRAGLVIAVALSVAAAGLAGWLWRPVAQLPAAASAPAAAAATAVLVPLPSPVTVAPRTVPTVTAATPPTANAKPANSASAAEPVVAVAPKAKSVVASAPAPTTAPLLSELPEATRREIPALVINGAVYSENPAQRLLLVNGQVLNQGSEVAPDLKVVEIRSNVTEFSYRGTRFRLAH